jgi:hypothetical protein
MNPWAVPETAPESSADPAQPGLSAAAASEDSAVSRQRLRAEQLGGDPHLFLALLAQHIAAPPHRLDVVLATRRVGQLLAQLADEDVDDLELGLVLDLVLLPGEVHAGTANLDRLGVEVDDEVAGLNHRLGVALGAAHDGVDAGNQLVFVERLDHVIVGP